MQCSPGKIRYTLTAAILAAFTLSAQAAETPRLQFTSGDVQIRDIDGNLRPAIKGDFIRPGERIITGNGGMAQLRMFNQGVVALKSGSEITVEPPVRDLFKVKIEKGLIRTVTKLADKVGKIDVITPIASIAVDTGDVLTGVSLDRADKTTHNQVLDGKVEIQSGSIRQIAAVGKVLEISPADGAVRETFNKPGAMNLRVPQPTLAADVRRPVAANDVISKPLVNREPATFGRDLGKIAAFQPDRVIPTKPVKEPLPPIKNIKPLVDVKPPVIEQVRINPIETRLSIGKVDDSVKNALGLTSNFVITETKPNGDVRVSAIQNIKNQSQLETKINKQPNIRNNPVQNLTKENIDKAILANQVVEESIPVRNVSGSISPPTKTGINLGGGFNIRK